MPKAETWWNTLSLRELPFLRGGGGEKTSSDAETLIQGKLWSGPLGRCGLDERGLSDGIPTRSLRKVVSAVKRSGGVGLRRSYSPRLGASAQMEPAPRCGQSASPSAQVGQRLHFSVLISIAGKATRISQQDLCRGRSALPGIKTNLI